MELYQELPQKYALSTEASTSSTTFLTAQKRVFPSGTQKDAKRSKKEQEGFEKNPKWEEIGRIVEEIREEVKAASAEGEKLMIVTRDERTAAQVSASS